MLCNKMRAESRQAWSLKDLLSHNSFPALIHQRLNVRIFIHWGFLFWFCVWLFVFFLLLVWFVVWCFVFFFLG